MLKQTAKRLVPPPLMRAYVANLRKETHINRSLSRFGGETAYLEIGVRDGECIRQIHAVTRYGVDPAPIDPDKIAGYGVQLFEATSDDFFARTAPGLLRGRVLHASLVDGLHEFRQALRDILNLEPYMHPAGVVFVHDCNPPTRRHEQDPNGPWNGDVWKVALYLRTYRRDLRFVTIDCDWGLGMISGFSGNAPAPDYGAIESIAGLDYDVLSRDRRRILNLRSPLRSLLFSRKGRTESSAAGR